MLILLIHGQIFIYVIENIIQSYSYVCALGIFTCSMSCPVC